MAIVVEPIRSTMVHRVMRDADGRITCVASWWVNTRYDYMEDKERLAERHRFERDADGRVVSLLIERGGREPDPEVEAALRLLLAEPGP